jgi:hypothetical protein
MWSPSNKSSSRSSSSGGGGGRMNSGINGQLHSTLPHNNDGLLRPVDLNAQPTAAAAVVTTAPDTTYAQGTTQHATSGLYINMPIPLSHIVFGLAGIAARAEAFRSIPTSRSSTRSEWPPAMTPCHRNTSRPETSDDTTLRNAMLLDHQLLQRQQIFANLVHNTTLSLSNNLSQHNTTLSLSNNLSQEPWRSSSSSRSNSLIAGREISPSVARYLALRSLGGHGSHTAPPLPFSGPSADGEARQ